MPMVMLGHLIGKAALKAQGGAGMDKQSMGCPILLSRISCPTPGVSRLHDAAFPLGACLICPLMLIIWTL